MGSEIIDCFLFLCVKSAGMCCLIASRDANVTDFGRIPDFQFSLYSAYVIIIIIEIVHGVHI